MEPKDAKRILAIDPGGMTGFALLYVTERTISIGEFPTHEKLNDLIREGDIVILEQPFLTISVDPIVFEVAGAVKERVYSTKAKLILARPSDPHYVWKRYKDDIVAKLPSQHQKDALAHIIYQWVNKWFYSIRELPNTIIRNGQEPLA